MPLDSVGGNSADLALGSPGLGRRLRAMFRFAFSYPVFLSFSLIALLALTVRGRFSNTDLWWHLRMGQIVWTTHSIPTTEILSYSAAGHTWIPHEWLSQLSIFGAYHVAGYVGLMLWLYVFASLLVVLLYLFCWLYSGNAKISFVGGLAGWFFGTVGLAIRPLMVGHLLLVIELLLLELGRKKDRRWFWALPALFAVWVNCHSSWPFGMVILLVTIACSFRDLKIGPVLSSAWTPGVRRTLIAGSVLSGLALFLNPAGWEALTYPLNALFLQHTGLSRVQEWQPLSFLDPRAVGLLIVLSGLALAAAAKAVQIRLEEAILCSLAATMAVRHQRMLFLFGIVVAPVVCRVLADSWERYDPKRDLRVANAVCMAIAAVVVVISFPREAELVSEERAANPIGAVEFIRKAQLSGPMMNAYDFGGYLIWMIPEHKVFVDGRADVFDWTGVLGAFERWSMLEEDPQILLKKYRIKFCVLESGSPIAQVMPYLPGWHKAFGDSIGTVFVYQDSPELGK
jgi:hypothetical protein